jgi:16S rRNA (adenine1518-N6/adenine1519-N6)-dimethyltransferase
VTLTRSEVRDLLGRHGLAPRRSDGQNFLVDPNTVRRIVAASGVGPDDHVIEIGPGLGAMTGELADTAATVTAIEIDAGLATVVADRLADRANLTVVHADAMHVDVDALGVGTRVVANLPYNVATPLLLHVFAGTNVADAYVMVQREVAERWVARPGDPAHGAVSIKLALVADLAIDLAIPRTVFWPVPNVDSVMVRAVRRDDAPDPATRAHVGRVVDVAFRQRRKTLRNNLRREWGTAGTAALAAAGIDPGRRAETLSVTEFVRLAAAVPEPPPA